ncbi:MAG: N-acetylneuraminate synthase family protein [Phycisphaerales bacterium]
MRIGDRQIGPAHAPYVIAEIGVNHDGSVESALELIDAAAAAGADAVKLQVFRAETLMSGGSRLADYQQRAGETDPIEMLRRLELPLEALGDLVRRAHDRSVHAIATVFSVDLVEPATAHAWDAVKTASPDIVHEPLLRALEATGLPLIVSTGAASLDEVERAARWLADARERLAVLQCVSAYPAPADRAALGAIREIAAQTALPVGYSDHTEDVETGAIAVGAGACLLEKHFTHSRAAQGPDHAASLEPEAFARYAALARTAHAMLGDGRKAVQDIEREVRTVSRQSLVLLAPVRAGERIDPALLACRRPGTGLAPWRVRDVAGRVAARDIPADRALVEEDLA